MGAVTPVAAYKPTNCTTQTGSDYKNTIDGNSVAAQRIVTRFAPHAASPANMTAVLDAGSVFDGRVLNEVSQQTTAAFVAPVNFPRIDRIVIDMISGLYAIVPGVESTTPLPPDIPNGKYPIAQVTLAVGMAALTNAAITDERNFSTGANAAFGAQSSLASAATCDLGAVLSRNVFITGTTQITSFGTSANTQSPIYLIEFAGALTLKSGPALLLPGGKDIQTSNNDTGMAEYLGAGNWRIRDMTRASGAFGSAASLDVGTAPGNVVQVDQNGRLPALDASQLIGLPASASAMVALQTVDVSSQAASCDFLNMDGTYDEYLFSISNLVSSSALSLYTSGNNGSTWDTGGSTYSNAFSGIGSGYSGSPGYGYIYPNVFAMCATLRLFQPSNTTQYKHFLVNTVGGAGANSYAFTGVITRNSVAAVNAVRFITGGSFTSGRITMFGVKHA